MRAVLPGRPEPRPQALATGFWDSRTFITYASGAALAILESPTRLVQTIYRDSDHVVPGDDDDDATPIVAVAFDEASGKIAVCTRRGTVRIYFPQTGPVAPQSHYYQRKTKTNKAWTWVLQMTFAAGGEGSVLSWGGGEELLVATHSLSLYSTLDADKKTANQKTAKRTWTEALPDTVLDAAVSHDSSHIASVGHGDRLVKVWRRINYGGDEVHFGLSYLRHPQAVTGVRWRRPFHADQTIDSVLYTFCADGVVRIWVVAEAAHCPHFVQWGQVDAGVSLAWPTTWVAVLDGREFAAAVEKGLENKDATVEKGLENKDATDRLVEVANKNPEVCLLFDGRGSMTAWALENVSSTTRGVSTSFSLAHTRTEGLEFDAVSPVDVHPYLHSYVDRKTGAIITLAQIADGRIKVYRSGATSLFSPIATKSRRLPFDATLSGHSAPIRKIVRNFSGQAVLSRTTAGEAIVWKHVTNSQNTRLVRQSVISEERHIRRIAVLRKGRFVVLLCDDSVALWDCRQSPAVLLCRLEHGIVDKTLCLIVMPRRDVHDPTVAHLATVTAQQQGIVWEVDLPAYRSCGKSTTTGNIREFCRFELQDAHGLAYVLPVDPAGATPIVSGFLDVFARDVAVSYTHTGRVDFWTARIDQHKDAVGWLSTCSTETGISDPALVSGSTLKKAALVNASRSQLTIWDVGGARLEYAQDFSGRETVQDLDWTSTPDSQSILAVGFQHRVVLMSQMRYDYLDHGPAWAAVREVRIDGSTSHPIGDSTWLSDGHLVVGTGHQLYVHDRLFGTSDSLVAGNLRLPRRRDGTWDLFDVAQRLNGPLPVFHPQFVSQCILAGKTQLVRRILLALYNTLKYHVEGERIDDYLGIGVGEFYGASKHVPTVAKTRQSLDLRGLDEEVMLDFSDETAERIVETLTRVAIPQLTGREQIQLANIIECVGQVELQRRSVDENGARFMLYFRQHALRKGQATGIHLSWREINWAYHSTSQDILTDAVARQYSSGMRWEHARESGMFMWLTDHVALKSQFETIARNEYARSDPKNPVDCSLFYLALRKKAILQGLWRIASWNHEQVATQRLLGRNFDDAANQRSALRNAYALLGKFRFEYAAAFFLLADRLRDAVLVCLRNLKDVQLAIAIARVYEGDSGPVLCWLLESEVLALAAAEGDRWLASWAFWMLGRRDMAVRALIAPVYTLVDTPDHPDLKSRSFLTSDPALVVLYGQLRHQTLQTLRGASRVTPRVEWEFVLHSARVYARMGCDLLGLDLVRNWEFFLQDASSAVDSLERDMKLLRMAGRRGSLVVDDSGAPGGLAGAVRAAVEEGEEKEKEKDKESVVSRPQTAKAPVPVQGFSEPDASSLLDSFGF